MKTERQTINQGLRCSRVYPVEGSTRDPRTVILLLTLDEANELASNLKRGVEQAPNGFGTIQLLTFRKPLSSDSKHQLCLFRIKGSPRRKGDLSDIEEIG
jgi:hypothetical protein